MMPVIRFIIIRAGMTPSILNRSTGSYARGKNLPYFTNIIFLTCVNVEPTWPFSFTVWATKR